MSGVYVISANRAFAHAFGKNAALARNASPLVHVKEKLCPFCLLYAERELPFPDHMAKQFSLALQKARCDVSIQQVKARDHRSIIVQAASNEADVTTQTIFAFIAKHSGLKLAP